MNGIEEKRDVDEGPHPSTAGIHQPPKDDDLEIG